VTRVKICGLVRAEDVRLAAECGADALGFIAVPESKRFVAPEAVAQLVREAPPFAMTVAVALDHATASRYPVSLAQLYEPPFTNSGVPCLRVFRLRDQSVAEEALAWPGPILLDAFADGALGGTGQRVDWRLAATLVRDHAQPVVLAGGLTPENVAEAVRTVRPYAVDVSSGVESAPGIKDPAKVRAFIAAVRNASTS